MRCQSILGKAVREAFLGRIMVFLVSATIRAEKRGSVGEAVVVRMGMCKGCAGVDTGLLRTRENRSQCVHANRYRGARGAHRRDRRKGPEILRFRATRFLGGSAVTIFAVLTPANTGCRFHRGRGFECMRNNRRPEDLRQSIGKRGAR
jgi:hypothetical protein